MMIKKKKKNVNLDSKSQFGKNKAIHKVDNKLQIRLQSEAGASPK